MEQKKPTSCQGLPFSLKTLKQAGARSPTCLAALWVHARAGDQEDVIGSRLRELSRLGGRGSHFLSWGARKGGPIWRWDRLPEKAESKSTTVLP